MLVVKRAAVLLDETGHLLGADVLVLADYVLYALILLLHHLAFPPVLLQLSSYLPVILGKVLDLLLQFSSLPLV